MGPWGHSCPDAAWSQRESVGTHLIWGRPIPAGTHHVRHRPWREQASMQATLLFRDEAGPIAPNAGTNRWGHPLAASNRWGGLGERKTANDRGHSPAAARADQCGNW